MKLFARGKGAAAAASSTPTYQPIDRRGLLGLLDQVVNGAQSGVLELREPKGTWTYAFASGALTHASGGRVRGARHAFDLLWEFQSGEFIFTSGANPSLAGNLYIDKSRLLDLLRRSQAVLQGPTSPYIAPDQQRPIAPVQRPYSPPSPGQLPPQWQPPIGPGPASAWPPAPGQPAQGPGPAWGSGGYPPPPPGYPQPYPQPYPQAPYGQNPGGQPYPPPSYPQPYPSAPKPPVFPGPYPAQQAAPPPAPPPMPAAPPRAPQPIVQAPPPIPAAPARQVTPPSFSVPPMAIPRRREAAPVYQPPVAPASAIPPVPDVIKPAQPSAPKDDLQSLRASLVSQAPPVGQAPAAPNWGVRTGDGTVAPAPAAGGKEKKGARSPEKAKRRNSKLRAAIDVQLIKFLLWACERRYSPDDHWTLRDAFEVSTMELRDQFAGVLSQSFKAGPKSKNGDDDDLDQMAAGRMRGRGRKR